MRAFIVIVAAACAPAADDTGVDTDPPAPTFVEVDVAGPHGVGVVSLELFDETRGTPANGSILASPRRKLVTEVWFPSTEGAVDAPEPGGEVAAGSFPVVLMSHGFLSSRLDLAGLAAHLASHGYVVAAPDFPLSKRTAPGGATVLDVPSQPGDLSFVLDALVAGKGGLSSVVDADRVAAVGLSLGGLTTLLVGLHPEWRDPRIDVLVPIAPASCYVPRRAFDAPTPPTLVVHGTADRIVDYEANALPLYEALDAPRVLAAFAEASHTGFPDATAELFEGTDDPDDVGCGAIGDAPSSGDEGTLDALVDDPGGVLNATCPLPCEGEAGGGVAMRPLRQVALLRASVRAFLDGWLRDDPVGRDFVLRGLALEADVDVTAQP